MSRCMFYAISSQTENERQSSSNQKRKGDFLTPFLPVWRLYKKKILCTTILFLLICTGVFYGVPTLQNDKNIGIFIHTQFLFFILSFNNFGVLFITRHFCFHVVI